MLAWAGEAEEVVLGAHTTGLEAHGCDLDKLVGIRRQAGGFEVIDHKRLPGVEAVTPDERVAAGMAGGAVSHQGLGAAEGLIAGWVGAGNLHGRSRWGGRRDWKGEGMVAAR